MKRKYLRNDQIVSILRELWSAIVELNLDSSESIEVYRSKISKIVNSKPVKDNYYESKQTKRY